MRPRHSLGSVALAFALAAAAILSGCGTPGAPMPPSLNLPDPVKDLSASRTGNRVSLSWTMPKRNTDKLLLKGALLVRVCRSEGLGACDPAGGQLQLAPGADGAFTETLPPALASGPPRSLTYFVELKNRRGRSAGLSNPALVLAGLAPGPVTGLSAEVQKDGVLLGWLPSGSASGFPTPTAIRLHRRLLTPPAASSGQGPFAPPPEPVEQTLLVASGAQSAPSPDRALDKSIRFGQTYEYRAQRIARVTVKGRPWNWLDRSLLLSASRPLTSFRPPSPPAWSPLPLSAATGAGAAIDLSWQPVDRSRSGRLRRLSPRGEASGSASRPRSRSSLRPSMMLMSSPATPTATPSAAIDQNGHESARSAETEETVPNP